jgi:hypothetical protein
MKKRTKVADRVVHARRLRRSEEDVVDLFFGSSLARIRHAKSGVSKLIRVRPPISRSRALSNGSVRIDERARFLKEKFDFRGIIHAGVPQQDSMWTLAHSGVDGVVP